MRLTSAMRIALVRNKLLITVIAITFFSIIIISAVVAYAVLLTSPDLMRVIEDFVGTTRTYADTAPFHEEPILFHFPEQHRALLEPGKNLGLGAFHWGV